MSIKILNTVWQTSQAKGSKLLVLLALADFADDDGANIYPSIKTLSNKARLSEDQTRRVVHELIASDELELVEEGGWTNGRNRSNEYRIILKETSPRRRKGGTSKLQVQSPRDARGGSSTDASTVPAPMQDDPSLQPSSDPSLKKRPPVAPVATDARPPAVVVFCEVHHRNPKKQQYASFDCVKNLDTWRTVCETWRDRGYNPTNIAGQLEWYADPSKMERYTNGHHAPTSKVQHSLDAVDAVFDMAERKGIIIP